MFVIIWNVLTYKSNKILGLPLTVNTKERITTKVSKTNHSASCQPQTDIHADRQTSNEIMKKKCSGEKGSSSGQKPNIRRQQCLLIFILIPLATALLLQQIPIAYT